MIEKVKNYFEKTKAILIVMCTAVVVAYGWVKKILKWLDSHTPLWVWNDILLWGGIPFVLVYASMSHYMGHGLPVSAAQHLGDTIVPAVATAPLAGAAFPVALVVGIATAALMIYLDWKAVKEEEHE